jgi:hypothetical protein
MGKMGNGRVVPAVDANGDLWDDFLDDALLEPDDDDDFLDVFDIFVRTGLVC